MFESGQQTGIQDFSRAGDADTEAHMFPDCAPNAVLSDQQYHFLEQ